MIKASNSFEIVKDADGRVAGLREIEMPNPYARISEVAAKVGVKPIDGQHTGGVVAEGADGKKYDIFDVVIAVLDRLEKAA